jgi:hypothetical protein
MVRKKEKINYIQHVFIKNRFVNQNGFYVYILIKKLKKKANIIYGLLTL